MMTEKFVVIVGNFTEGYRTFGPFASFDEAADCADGCDSWITTLHPASELEFV